MTEKEKVKDWWREIPEREVTPDRWRDRERKCSGERERSRDR